MNMKNVMMGKIYKAITEIFLKRSPFLQILVVSVTITQYLVNSNYAYNLEEIIITNTGLINYKTYSSYEKEILRYRIGWEFIYAGDAEMGIIPIELYGRKIYRIYTETKSNKTIDAIYKVRNKTESYVDYYGFYSLRFYKDQNEAGYVSKDNVVFDHKNNLWYNLIDNTTGYIPRFVQDVVSSLYWLRLQDIKVGEVYTFKVWVGKVVYPMIVDVIEICKIKVHGKEYECFKVEPRVDLQSFPLFKAKGRLFVYLTRDKRKLPVRLESKVFIGRVIADFVEEK
ncbi:MAG: DUF3108 domain-containing protein [Endomicrobia bacterium]|nr:DUF3108 domain-containing protein [Endomicrobiia bacterium]